MNTLKTSSKIVASFIIDMPLPNLFLVSESKELSFSDESSEYLLDGLETTAKFCGLKLQRSNCQGETIFPLLRLRVRPIGPTEVSPCCFTFIALHSVIVPYPGRFELPQPFLKLQIFQGVTY